MATITMFDYDFAMNVWFTYYGRVLIMLQFQFFATLPHIFNMVIYSDHAMVYENIIKTLNILFMEKSYYKNTQSKYKILSS